MKDFGERRRIYIPLCWNTGLSGIEGGEEGWYEAPDYIESSGKDVLIMACARFGVLEVGAYEGDWPFLREFLAPFLRSRHLYLHNREAEIADVIEDGKYPLGVRA